jgi:protein-S-isoprenylcysteine O-methyltransferase Ste14
MFRAYVAIPLAKSLGSASLLLFLLFLCGVSWGVWDLRLSLLCALTWNAALSLVFFVQHSVMIRRSVRRRLAGVVPTAYYGVAFAIASGITLLAFLLLWQESGHTVVTLRGPMRIGVRIVALLSIAGLVWGVLALGAFDAFGTRALKAAANGNESSPSQFMIRGPYRYVRHPLYFFTLMLIWTSPDVTAERLLFNVLWTAWVIIGTLLEERDLVAEFGGEFREYQRRVPMLVPWRLLARFVGVRAAA